MNQEQSSNDADFWADHVCRVIDGIAKWDLLPQQKEAIKRSVRGWVIDIREDETQAIIRQIEKDAAKLQGRLTSTQIVATLRERLSKRF